MSEKQASKQRQHPEDEFPRQPPSFPLPICPKCRSNNTEFCHSTNPRCFQLYYLCKNCCRYFIHGRALQKFLIGETSDQKQVMVEGEGEGESSSSGNGAGPTSLYPWFPPPPSNSINRGFQASGAYLGGGDFHNRQQTLKIYSSRTPSP